MNNTQKGLPATCYHRAKHKNTKLQRRAKFDKAMKEWSAAQVGLGQRKAVLRQLARQKPETKQTETGVVATK